ncbi:hypothetical protein [Deinococcus actinosclerus]|uniref:Uncharacterized protein n=1 Tax=Deinococcus actinosclerus TaxID=1768108 RepID=A0ABM5X777_9DEIO|nr:hypothetical protein [Deinococcus actinosclerus]ALW89642.1 hypothetical protein AUC44_12640 [Deinococcus actinosclerus]
MITAEQINAAFGAVAVATHVLASSTEIELQRRARLEQFKSEAIAAGQIDGKNAEAREGQLRALLAEDYGLLEKAARDVAQDRMLLTVAQLEVDRCKTLLKLLEVTGGQA